PRDFPFHQTLSATPLFIPLGNFSADYERTLGIRGLTGGVSGTYNTTTQLYPRRDRWAKGRLMYYPGGVALDGFGIGVAVGAHRAERRHDEDPAVVLAHDGAATLGAIATYNYFFGPRQRLFFGPGFGIDRVLKSVPVNSPLSSTYYEVRASLGIAL
ncbi:MAG TPA: hypothetical protein VGD56_16875, partial [Gemmatirosa sp.]